MSKKSFASAMNDILSDLETQFASQGNLVADNVVRGTYSQESLQHFHNDFESQTNSLRTTIIDSIGKLEGFSELDALSMESNESINAGLIAGLASRKPRDYHRAALSATASQGISLESLASGIGGDVSLVPADSYSQEAFDDTALAGFVNQNVVYNVLASRQDPFSEAFFGTKVLTPAEPGLQITVDKQEVIDYALHPTTGQMLRRNARNLIDAFTDSTVLNRPSTDLIPWAKADNSNASLFAPAAEVATTNVEMGGVNVPTRPLRIGKKVNILGLSQHPGLVDNGVLDVTDQIAPGGRLKAVYLKLTDGTSTEVFRFNTLNMHRNQFKKAPEGEARDVQLTFITDSLVLDKAALTTAGAASTLLASFLDTQGLVVRLSTSVNALMNLSNGNVDPSGGSVNVEAVVDATGTELSLEEGVGKQVVDAIEGLKAEIEYVDFALKRSNSNWRTVGTLIDVTPVTESFQVEPGYPITVLTPTDEAQNGAKIAGMINAARLRNSNNAVTTLLNYAEQLEAYKEAIKRGVKVDILGAGRHIVKPFFETDVVDVKARVVVEHSAVRSKDVSQVLVDAIREMAYRMLRDSMYGTALDLANAGTATKPVLLIGCDEVTKRWLDIQADPRLLGEHMDYVVVSTPDDRLENTIYMTFTRNRPGSEDGLSFGTHAYIPELIQRVTTQHNGATSQHDRVIPRSVHVPVLPVLARLDIVNLKEAITNVAP